MKNIEKQKLTFFIHDDLIATKKTSVIIDWKHAHRTGACAIFSPHWSTLENVFTVANSVDKSKHFRCAEESGKG